MIYYTILYYTILYYNILYYTMLYSTLLYSTILYYTIPYYTVLYCTIAVSSAIARLGDRAHAVEGDDEAERDPIEKALPDCLPG